MPRAPEMPAPLPPLLLLLLRLLLLLHPYGSAPAAARAARRGHTIAPATVPRRMGLRVAVPYNPATW